MTSEDAKKLQSIPNKSHWVYMNPGKWVNANNGLVVTVRENGNLYVVAVFSLHNPADRTTDGNNEVTETVASFEEALRIVRDFVG